MFDKNLLAITDGVTCCTISSAYSNEQVVTALLQAGLFGNNMTNLNTLVSDARIRHQLPIVPANVRISQFV